MAGELDDLLKGEVGDILKIVVALIPVIKGLAKDIKKAKETGDEEKVKDAIRNLDTERVRKLILGEL
jgi:hypothetical protein